MACASQRNHTPCPVAKTTASADHRRSSSSAQRRAQSSAPSDQLRHGLRTADVPAADRTDRTEKPPEYGRIPIPQPALGHPTSFRRAGPR